MKARDAARHVRQLGASDVIGDDTRVDGTGVHRRASGG